MIMKTSYLSKFCVIRSNAVIVSCLSLQVTPGPARPRHGTGARVSRKKIQKNCEQKSHISKHEFSL